MYYSYYLLAAGRVNANSFIVTPGLGSCSGRQTSEQVPKLRAKQLLVFHHNVANYYFEIQNVNLYCADIIARCWETTNSRGTENKGKRERLRCVGAQNRSVIAANSMNKTWSYCHAVTTQGTNRRICKLSRLVTRRNKQDYEYFNTGV